jgi:hypothetical protein
LRSGRGGLGFNPNFGDFFFVCVSDVFALAFDSFHEKNINADLYLTATAKTTAMTTNKIFG